MQVFYESQKKDLTISDHPGGGLSMQDHLGNRVDVTSNGVCGWMPAQAPKATAFVIRYLEDKDIYRLDHLPESKVHNMHLWGVLEGLGLEGTLLKATVYACYAYGNGKCVSQSVLLQYILDWVRPPTPEDKERFLDELVETLQALGELDELEDIDDLRDLEHMDDL